MQSFSRMVNSKLETEFVISGISGRFPKASSVVDFWNSLQQKQDGITADQVPFRSGKLDEVNKFDADFFDIGTEEAESLDIRLRLMLELVHEAVVDAGVSPTVFRGTNTGVFLGASGECISSLSGRISSAFGLKGPSQTVENGSQDSSVALFNALQALRSRSIEAAIVSGVQINPTTCPQSQVSPDGKCKSFDANANGIVPAEAAVVIYITSKDSAKRNYATLVNAGSNASDSKTPAEQFLIQLYADSKVSPGDVAYVESNSTGIKFDDQEEANALATVLSAGREGSPIIELVKSNVGHAGPAAGIVGLVRLLLFNHFDQVPPNVKFESLNPDIPELTDSGRKYAALNSIVNDGTNVHIILEFPRKEPAQLVLPPIPVFVPISGRTSPGVEYQMKRIVTGVKNQHLVGLLHEAYKIKIPQHPFRGYVLSSRTESKQNIGNRLPRSKSPLWFIFTGLGNQWVGMTKDMVKFKTFNDSIHKSAKILKEKENYDLLQVLESTDPAYLDDFKNSIAAITSVQIALMDLFNVIGIQPDGIVGYSTGECCSGYADGCFSHEQSLLVSFSRARAFTESNLPPGSVAAVGLSWDQAKRRCPRGIYPAIHNSESLVSISGPPGDVQKFTAKLKSENIFAQEVKSAIYGFHSPLVAGSEKLMRELLGKIITEPKPRSKKWISTSILAEKWDSGLAKYSSVDYHVNNALSPVFFYVTLKHIPMSSVVVEIGPHGFLQSIIKQGAVGSALVVALMDQKSNDNTKFYLDSLGKLYLHGVDLDAGKLYEPVQFPVQSGTPSLSPMIKWDHTRSWSVPQIKN